MDLRKWLIPCVLALAFVVPVAHAADKTWRCQKSTCVAGEVCAAAQQADDPSCSDQCCNCFFKTVMHWLGLDSICGYEEDEQPAAGQEEEGCDPEVVHPQSHLHIQILLAPCPWAQLGQFQIFRMIRPGQCQVPQENFAAPINEKSKCDDNADGEKQNNESCIDEQADNNEDGCCTRPTGCERVIIERIMTPPQEMCLPQYQPATMPACPLPQAVFAAHPVPCCPPLPSAFTPICPTPSMSTMAPICPMGSLTGNMPFGGMCPMPPFTPSMTPMLPTMPSPMMQNMMPPCPMPQPCVFPMPPMISTVPQADECLKACVRSGKICLQVPGCAALKVSAEDLNVKLADGREWSCSVTEDGKIAIECDGDKSECTFAAEADRLSVEQDNNRIVLEGGVTLRYRWKDGKTGGLVEAERCCFDVTTGAMQIETACKHLKKAASCPVERAKYCPISH